MHDSPKFAVGDKVKIVDVGCDCQAEFDAGNVANGFCYRHQLVGAETVVEDVTSLKGGGYGYALECDVDDYWYDDEIVALAAVSR